MTYFPELADPAIRLAPMDEAVRRFQARYITTALIRNKAHLVNTAKELGIHRNTLARLCEQSSIGSCERRSIRKLARRVA